MKLSGKPTESTDYYLQLSQCAQRIYLLKLLQRQGMPRNLLAVVTYSIVISRVSYALPAWGGFLSVELVNKINSLFKRLLQFGYISDRIVVGDLLDDADHDLFRKVCHPHHSLNHLLPPKRIFTNLQARAGHPFHIPEYTTLLHK